MSKGFSKVITRWCIILNWDLQIKVPNELTNTSYGASCIFYKIPYVIEQKCYYQVCPQKFYILFLWSFLYFYLRRNGIRAKFYTYIGLLCDFDKKKSYKFDQRKIGAKLSFSCWSDSNTAKKPVYINNIYLFIVKYEHPNSVIGLHWALFRVGPIDENSKW